MTETAKKPAIRFAGFTEALPAGRQAGWEQRKLSEIATMHARIGWQNLRTSEFLDSGEYMLITGTDFDDGKINFATCHYVEKERYEQDKNIQIENGSILITKDGTLGKVAYVKDLSMPATLNAGVFNVVIKDKKAVDNKYLFQYLKAPFLMDYVDKKATGGTIKHLNQNILVDFPIVMPQKAEQEAIGTFFGNLDNLITLHQRKYDKLVNVKKSCLEKMFPKNGSNVPAIRFAGFTESWEQRKLGETLYPLQNNTLSRAELSSEKGIALNIHYGDVLIKFGEYLDVKRESLPYIADEGLVAKYKASYLQNGDVIVADTAEDETVGKCTEIAGLRGEIAISGLHTIPYRPLADFASGYLGYYMNSESYHQQLLPLMQGIKVTSISKTAMQNTDICFPKDKSEQAEISTFFRGLDNLITLHQRELEKLQNLKKACLEKMFV